MLNRIIYWSIHNKLIVAFSTLSLILWGLFSLAELPIDAIPDITNNQVQIVTTAPSSSAIDIERFVTFPVEKTMATIPGIEEMRSFSRFGLSVVTIVFSEQTDIYWARQQVQERLGEAKNSIPSDIGEPSLAPLSTGLGEIYQYTIRAKKGYEKKYNATELRSIQDWIIKRQLLGVKGVADVSSFGGYVKTYEIAIDPILLKANEISIEQVLSAVEKNNKNTGGTYIEHNHMTTFIRSEGLVNSIADIENIQILNTRAEVPIFIRDIAKVHLGSHVRYGALTYNDKGEAVGGIVLMLKGANSSEVISLVKERMAQIEKNLPEGILLEVYLDRTNLVDRAIQTVSTNLVEGALIVIFVLVLLLGNFRAGLIVASVIPLAMLFAISLMRLFGVSGNLMSLGALDFGLIVDGAVIIVESTLHLLQAKGIGTITQLQMNDKVYKSTSKFSKSAVFGQIIILVVYLPILALVGIEGKMFKPMAQTVIFAILGALLLSLTYVPMLSAVLLSKQIKIKQNFSSRIIGWIQKAYLPLLKKVLRQKRLVLMMVAILLALSVWVFNRLGAEFIPSLDEGDFAVETRLMTGSGLNKTIDQTTKASQILLSKYPEIKQVIGKIGTAEIPTDPMPIEACDLMLILKDKDQWKTATNKEDLAAKMQETLARLMPSVSFGFQQPIQMRFNELMTGAKQDVVIKVFGEDFDRLAAYAKHVGSLAKNIDGVKDIYVEELSGLPQLLVRFNRDALARYHVSIDDANRAVNLGFAGKSAGFVFEGERKFDLVLKLNEASRSDIADINQLYVSNDEGALIPLSELAEIELENGPNQIQRDDAKRRILVGFNVRGRDVESIVEELKLKIDQNIHFQTGYFLEIGGVFENLMHARNRLLIAVPISLILIFFLLYLAFNSLRQATLIYTAIPLASIGGVLALYFRSMPFSISAGVGFIALFGVAVLNGIVLISEFNTLRKTNMRLTRVVVLGTLSRLRPVLLTASVASLGFLPMALSQGSGAEIQRPLATVVIGGLISATILTLFILPLLYLLIEQPKKWIKKKPRPVLLFLLIPTLNFSQNALTDEQFYDLLLRQNGYLNSAKIEVQRQSELAQGAASWQPFSASYLQGQYNSIYTKDKNITLSQSIPYNGSLKLQKEIGLIQGQISEQEFKILQRDLKRQLDEHLENIRYLTAKLSLLSQQDSVYGILEQKILRTIELGESKRLDQVLIHTKAMRVKANFQLQEQALKNAWEVLYAFIGIQNNPYTLAQKESIDFLYIPPLKTLETHPYLLGFDGQHRKLNMESELIKLAQYPSLSLSYFNQSLVGWQTIEGVDQFFGQKQRFQGGAIQTEIPIDFKAFKSRIAANQHAIEQNQLERKQQEMWLVSEQKNLYNQLTERILSYKELAGPIENELIKLQEDLQIQLSTGEISFIEFLQLHDYRMGLQTELLDWQHEIKLLLISYNWIQ